MTAQAEGDSFLRYSRTAVVLHWLIAALLVLQLGLGWRLHSGSWPDTTVVMSLHKSTGIIILLLTLVRIGWRMRHSPPPASGLSPLERQISAWVHMGFFVLLLALPLTGWIMASATRGKVIAHVFGVIPWPRMPLINLLPAGAQQIFSSVSSGGHTFLAYALLALLFLHVAGALKHQFISRDQILARMAPGVRAGSLMQARVLIIPVVAVAAFAAAFAVPHPSTAVARPNVANLARADVFSDIVHPILIRRCGSCHNDGRSRGGFSVIEYESLLAGGYHGAAVVPGQPEGSELLRRITLDPFHKNFMPAEGRKPLSPSQIQAIRWWISVGAKPSGMVGAFQVSDDSQIALQQVLQLGGAQNVTAKDEQSLPIVTMADATAVAALQAAGFVVRRVDASSNLLDVNRYRYTQLTADHLASLSRISEQIRTLSIRASELSDWQLDVIGKMVNLELLQLNDNPITDAGIGKLNGLRSLRFISLSGTKVTDAGLVGLSRLPSLRRLYASNSGVKASAIRRLESVNPNWTVTAE